MCGPPPMVEAAAEEMLARHGIDERRTFELSGDPFRAALPVAVPAAGRASHCASARVATRNDVLTSRAFGSIAFAEGLRSDGRR